MTLICGFTSKDLAFLAADDWEPTYGTKADKVKLLWGRFAVAVQGVKDVADAVELRADLDQSGFLGQERPTTAQRLSEQVAEITYKYADSMRPVWKKRLAWDDYKNLVTMDSALFVLDADDNTLWRAGLGRPHDPKSRGRNLQAIQQPAEQFLVYGPVAGGKEDSSVLLTPAIKADPVAAATGEILKSHGRKPALRGKALGSYVLSDANGARIVSAYKDLDDYLRVMSARALSQ